MSKHRLRVLIAYRNWTCTEWFVSIRCSTFQLPHIHAQLLFQLYPVCGTWRMEWIALGHRKVFEEKPTSRSYASFRSLIHKAAIMNANRNKSVSSDILNNGIAVLGTFNAFSSSINAVPSLGPILSSVLELLTAIQVRILFRSSATSNYHHSEHQGRKTTMYKTNNAGGVIDRVYRALLG